jgi:hypothetical protein
MVLGVAGATNNFGSMNFDYVGSGSSSNRLAFGFYGTPEYLDILASGKIGVGTSSPQALLGLQGAIGVNASQLYLSGNGNVGIGTSTPYGRLEVWGPDSAASTTAFSVVNNASTTVFAAYDNGNATYSGSIFQSSDQRLKTNITTLDASASLALVNQLNPVSYTRIDQPDQATNLGFIAQEVQKLFPTLVSTSSPTALTPDGTLTLNYQGLIAPLVKAVQNLSLQLTSLQSTVAGFARAISTQVINATTGNFSNELCVGSTCVTPAQFQAMVAATTASQNGSSLNPTFSANNTSTTTSPTPPVIQINGNNPAAIQVGTPYTDLGATITGPQQDINLDISTFLNGTPMYPVQLDTSAPATDTIDYVVTDQNGVTSTSTRTVIIEAATSSPSVQ